MCRPWNGVLIQTAFIVKFKLIDPSAQPLSVSIFIFHNSASTSFTVNSHELLLPLPEITCLHQWTTTYLLHNLFICSLVDVHLHYFSLLWLNSVMVKILVDDLWWIYICIFNGSIPSGRIHGTYWVCEFFVDITIVTPGVGIILLPSYYLLKGNHNPTFWQHTNILHIF